MKENKSEIYSVTCKIRFSWKKMQFEAISIIFLWFRFKQNFKLDWSMVKRKIACAHYHVSDWYQSCHLEDWCRELTLGQLPTYRGLWENCGVIILWTNCCALVHCNMASWAHGSPHWFSVSAFMNQIHFHRQCNFWKICFGDIKLHNYACVVMVIVALCMLDLHQLCYAQQLMCVL